MITYLACKDNNRAESVCDLFTNAMLFNSTAYHHVSDATEGERILTSLDTCCLIHCVEQIDTLV